MQARYKKKSFEVYTVKLICKTIQFKPPRDRFLTVQFNQVETFPIKTVVTLFPFVILLTERLHSIDTCDFYKY